MKHLTRILLVLMLLLPLAAWTATPAHASTGYSGYPTFSITSVVKDVSVTILTNNLPANDTFDVLMNYIGTRGVGGLKVAVQASGTGGAQTFTYAIPDFLEGQYQIAIRLQSPTSGYYAYNWFYNNTTGGATPPPAPTPAPGGYSGYPTFSITGVVRDTHVTIKTNNLPPNDSFDVLMNYIGTRGVSGVKVAVQASGAGGTQTFTYNIPDFLKGQYKIAIRLQSNTGSGYYAYNWFYNNTTK